MFTSIIWSHSSTLIRSSCEIGATPAPTPATAGDTALTEAVRHLKAGGTTVVFVTHKTNMLQLADQVLLMDQGTVRLYGERDEVMAHFSGPKVVPTSPHPHVAAIPTPTVQAPAAAS